jgi:crotonobetainyl-CoA:carnitine CoA-transferase CaiB-like acyl-CoA transferase
MIVDVDHPTFGSIREVASPIHIGGVRKTNDPAPALGEHTEAILTEWLGYGSEQIRWLRKEGVI